MKTAIYYFTSTGNSLYAAKLLAEQLKDSKVVSMVKALASDKFTDAKRIILVFPVYMYRAPHIVCRFIKKLKTESRLSDVSQLPCLNSTATGIPCISSLHFRI